MSKIVKCKTCDADMASNAKTCPSCGAKNKKPVYKKWWFWLIIVIVVIAVASSGGNDSGNNTDDVTVSNTAEQKEVIYNVGDTITTDKFDITVTDVKTAKKVGSTYLSQDVSDGGIYVIVEWEYKNISDSPISSFSCPMLKVVDQNGTKYDADINASTYYSTEVNLDTKILSDLNPGIKVKDADVFEISEEAYNAGGFSIKVDADKDFEIKIN